MVIITHLSKHGPRRWHQSAIIKVRSRLSEHADEGGDYIYARDVQVDDEVRIHHPLQERGYLWVKVVGVARVDDNDRRAF